MTSAPSCSNSAQASSSRSWKYDVFISFRGDDTRKTFVDHLYSALVQRLIRVYKDDEALPRGDSIGPSLLKSIEESHIAVIVFSENYADSLWCLDELAHIMKCRDDRGLTVIPIFYDVDPSDVRHQKRKFGEAFAKHEAENFKKADLWRKALIEASNIAGWEPKHIANGHESKVIKEIVDKIQDYLLSLDSDVDEEFVGMRVRSQDLISLLEIESGGVRMVGIWGIGGSGKTTLAYSVYTKVSHHFQGQCFIANIREQSKHGLETLQQKFLSSVMKTQAEVQSVEEGKFIIKSRLCNSKVLVLLDDVDDLDQLQALAGSHKWFGAGSRIIITTRDEHVLRAHRVDHISPVKLLSHKEAVLLFYKHAHNEKEPLTDYETLSSRVVSYAAGLPLALKVLGSFLFDKDENEWISALAKLKDFPNIKIMDILRISYDGLEPLQKELFLDIACFFRGKSTDILDPPMEILDACGLHPVIGIKVLHQRALISIVGGMFDMHDLVQEMGHNIVTGEHPNNPEKHSRVWKKEEINNMHLGEATKENHKIEAVDYSGHLSCFGEIISNMKKLRWFSYNDDTYKMMIEHEMMIKPPSGRLCFNLHDDEDVKYAEMPNILSNELRYISWGWYPESPFPDSFPPLKLCVLKIKESLQKELWNGYKHLPHLKVLKLHGMRGLLNTPDFDGLPCLQKLDIFACYQLEEIHPSLGTHRNLEYVSVGSCLKLRIFPAIVRLEKLNTLKIARCNRLVEVPVIQANMERLVELNLSKGIIKFPDPSIWERCTQVETVFNQLTRFVEKLNFRCLRKLSLCNWGLKDGEIPSNVGELSNLEELDLNGNDFSRLGFSLSYLARLRFLCLSGCRRLVELPELPSSLAILEADYCDSLISIGSSHRNCKGFYKVSLVGGGVLIDGSSLLDSVLQGSDIENHCMILRLEGLEIPKRFLPCLVSGNTRKFQLPGNWCNDFSGFLICVACTRDLDPYKEIVIRMEQAMSGGLGMDSRYEHEAWKESADDKRTWVAFVSFDILKHTLWWDDTYNALSFSVVESSGICRGFGFGFVPKKVGIASAETSTWSPAFSNYSPHFTIEHDSASSLKISFNGLVRYPIIVEFYLE
uniref:disease resistance protein Roq1-like n=1 Tax=Erigeron canadensis TaxID=72917 RepID=UPI001CB9604C|nr:disease resistance protein Roq1-like [Erigeron canadensis]